MKQKLFFIFVDADRATDVGRLLDDCELPGYTEITGVLGKGATGKKFGSRAFPGSSTLYLAAVDPECEQRLAEKLKSLQATRDSHEGLKAYAIEMEGLL